MLIRLPVSLRFRWLWSRDDWKEQPREPAGSSKGGQFAAAGGGGGGLTLPGKIGSGQYHTAAVAKLEAAAQEGYKQGGKAGATAAVEEAAKAYKHAQVQGYAKKLKQIIAEHPEPEPEEGPPEPGPPSEAEMEAQAAAEPEAPKLPEPEGLIQETIYKAAIDPESTDAQKLDLLSSALKAWPKHADYTKSVMAAMGVEPPEEEAPKEEPPAKGELPKPETNSQATVYKIVNNAGLSLEEKIAAISEKIEHYQHEPNKEYAQKALAQLQQTEAPWPTPEEIKAAQPEPKPAAQAIEEAKSGVIPDLPNFAKGNGTVVNIHSMAKAGYTSAADLDDYLQKGINSGLIGKGSAEHGFATAVIKAKEAQEAKATEPEKGAVEKGVDVLSQVPGVSPTEKIVAIKSHMAKNSLAPEAAHKYAEAKIAELEAEQEKINKSWETKQEAATPEAQGLKPIPIPEHPSGIAEIPPPPTSKNPAAMKAYKIAADPKKDVFTKYDDLDQLEKSSGGVEALAYIKQVKEIVGPMPGGSMWGLEEGAPSTPAAPVSFPTLDPTGISIASQNKAALIHAYANSDLPAEQKIKQIEGVQSISNKVNGYKEQAIKALKAAAGGEPPPPPEPTPQEKAAEAMKGVPAPHPDSPGQKNVHAAAQTGSTLEEKIKAVQEAAAKHSGAYTKSYAEEVLKALGHDPQAQAKAAQAKAAAATPAAAKPAAAKKQPTGKYGGVLTTAPTNTMRYKKAVADAEAAAKPNGTGKFSGNTAEAHAICPSLSQEFWGKLPKSQKSSFKKYTDSYYDAVNSALRGEGKVSPEVAATINGMDDMFHMEGANLAQDVRLTRGVDLPAKIVNSLVSKMESGVPATYTFEGYGSTSMHETPAFAHKNCWLIITAKKGTPALGVDTISSHPENEILMRDGQACEVYQIEKTSGRTYIYMVTK